ncbi:MAG TPA: dTMP kinase [Candidatus Saccharimonadales bacterium]
MVDGIDGVGKSTQIEILKKRLIAEGHRVETSRLPGGTEIGEALRSVMLSDLPRTGLTDIYIAMAMNSELSVQVKKWREDNVIVLVDRSPFCLIAYQSFGENADIELASQMFRRAMEMLTPNQVLVYDLPTVVALSRDGIGKHKKDYYTKNGIEFFDRSRDGFKYAVTNFPDHVTLKDIKGMSVDEVAELTYAMLRDTIAKSISE